MPACTFTTQQADVNAQDEAGQTVLVRFLLLLAIGLCCDFLFRMQHYAFSRSGDTGQEKGPIELISDLGAIPGVLVNVKDNIQRTALHYAALAGAPISTLYLLKRGAKIDDRGKD